MSILPEGLALQLLKFSSIGLGQDCVLCAAAAGESLLCAACERRLARRPAPEVQPLPAGAAFEEALAAFDYRFPVDRLVHRFKFGGDLAVGRWLARNLALAARGWDRPDCLVVPPLSAARLRERGFNQALELARVVGDGIGVPVDREGVQRVRETVPQHSLGAAARRRNLRGAFCCRRNFRGEAVAIVDDVLTTGATADALAQALKRSGAGRVSVWALALAPDPRR